MSEDSSQAHRAMLERLGISDLAQELPPLPNAELHRLAPDVPELKGNYVTAKPSTFEEAKRLLGIPDGLVADDARAEYREVDLSVLPEESFTPDQLTAEQRRELDRHAWNLLLGPTDGIDLDEEPTASTVRYILDRAARVPVLLAEDLDVKNGQTVELQGPTAVFNTITVHGTGSIVLDGDVKIVADKITYLSS